MKKRLNILYFLSLFTILVSFAACNSGNLYKQQHQLAKEGWHQDSVIRFEFTVQEPNKVYHLLYNLRYQLSYPYYNLHLKYTMLDSNFRVVSSEMQDMNLMHPSSGMPLGSGYGEMYDIQVLALPQFKFPYAGKYYFEIRQYMRKEVLQGIVAVGIEIEEQQEN
jgi:gliding motility-associated lipoprotein GldH